jgi:iron-sulfur cluster assembly protein
MVTLTDHAIDAIQNLTERPDAPEGGGLRIATDDTRGSLQLSLAPTPAAGDAVVESGGARLFLDNNAAAMLNDRTLDARTDPDGQVVFTLAEPFG